MRECFEKGLLRRISKEPAAASTSLKRAKKFISKAENIMSTKEYDVSLTLAYNSMLHSVRALLFSVGVKERSHYCAVLYARENFEIDLTAAETYRQIRHRVMYESEDVVREDAVEAISDAKEILKSASELLK